MFDQAYKSLTRGLRELDLRGTSVPCELVLAGVDAFPLAMNSQGQVLMAASLYGRGRIVVIGHETYLTTLPALVENAVNWLMGSQTARLSVAVHASVQAVAANLRSSGFQADTVHHFSETQRVGVCVTDAYSVDANADELVAFLKAGGGVLIAGQAWYWASQNPNQNTLLKFPGNKVSGVAGIYFSSTYAAAENLPVYPKVPTSLKAVHVGWSFEKDLEFLLNGTSQFDIRGDFLSSEALVHGPLAFSIGATDDGKTFLAGGYYGRGRVILMTHESMLNVESLSTFCNKAVHWLDQDRSGVVGFMPGLSLLPNLGLQSQTTDFRRDLSVFVCTTYSDQHLEEIQEFVAEGGGLLIGGHAWYWASSHVGQNPLTDYSGNRILNKMGLSVLETTVPAEQFSAPAPSQARSQDLHFRRLLQRTIGHITQGETLSSQEEARLKNLGRDCAHYLRMEAHDSFSYTQVLSFLTDTLKWGMPQPSEETAVSSPTDYFLLSVAAEVYNNCRNPDALLPYLIKDNPQMSVVYNQRISINAATAANEQRISTGLYLAPGMKTYMIMPTNIINRRWKVLIGCQTDILEHAELKRAPKVSEFFPVTSDVMQVWNLWGGLIYLVAPPDTRVEGSEVIVEKAVSAPYYKSETTSVSDWREMRSAPAPWAELEFDNIILTLPSRFIRELENPDHVAVIWNKIMQGVSELSAIPEKFPRKERIVADLQISAGWMHSGYPIMMHSSIAAELVKPDDARTKGLWGEVHELGHNQQQSHWEFPPHTTEATCNLWSVYVHEEKLGVNRAQAHPSMTPQSRQQCIDEFIRNGRRLSDWNVWTALETFLQLQGKFGWDAFKRVFSAYQGMSDFPSDNPGKMNLYAETFSLMVGMNLTDFFMTWSWPIQQATVGKLTHLPPWRDHPMARNN